MAVGVQPAESGQSQDVRSMGLFFSNRNIVLQRRELTFADLHSLVLVNKDDIIVVYTSDQIA